MLIPILSGQHDGQARKANMKIQVLGSGCPTCKKLHQSVVSAVEKIDREDIEVEYLTGDDGVQEIIKLGVMQTPVLTVNGKVVMTGYSGDEAKVKEVLLQAQKNL